MFGVFLNISCGYVFCHSCPCGDLGLVTCVQVLWELNLDPFRVTLRDICRESVSHD